MSPALYRSLAVTTTINWSNTRPGAKVWEREDQCLIDGLRASLKSSQPPRPPQRSIYMGREIKRRQKKLRNLFDVLGPDSAVMADHLEELARRGVIRPYRPTTTG